MPGDVCGRGSVDWGLLVSYAPSFAGIGADFLGVFGWLGVLWVVQSGMYLVVVV